MCQRRPADPTDPGDAADLSIMGYFEAAGYFFPARRIQSLLKAHSPKKIGKSTIS